ncbi:halocyanin-like protein (copper-containing protein) 2 [Natronolimnohabitans innermongolicus JCM 12255]|uniref:Halocyanin-like protein (Copper-containing protein) 2 n=1 Tax=Natronolimnohabitans innermongolicus JCM 12255 TaxID=1227499 RepID=L9XDQ3_9EURY|nr:halocyanin-like protein (copper-containing protein) 2 [Natronolimnohabitans innermongolicus JCM 12255]
MAVSGRSTRRRLLKLSGVTLVSGVAGCLRGEVGAGDPDLGDPKPYVEVTFSSGRDDEHADPAVAHLVDGGTVEWVADGGKREHAVAAYHPSTHGDQRRIPDGTEPWESADLTDGESFDRVFDEEGVFDYVCRPHEADGAVGSIVVGWPEPDEEPGLEPPSDSYPAAAAEAIERRNERVRDVLEEVHE